MFNKIFRLFSPETRLITLLFIAFMFTTERFYILIFTVTGFLIYKINKDFLTTLWLLLIVSLLTQKIFPIDLNDVPLTSGLSMGNSFYYSDLLLGVVVYFLLSRYKLVRSYFESKKLNSQTVKYLVIFTVISLITVIIVGGGYDPVTSYITLIKFIIIFLVGGILFKINNGLTKNTLEILYVYVILNSIIIGAQYFIGGPLGFDFEDSFLPFGKYAEEYLFRPGGFSADPNVSSSIAASILPYAVYLAVKKYSKTANVFWVGILIIWSGIIFTASRSVWMVAGVIFIFSLKIYNNFSWGNLFKSGNKIKILLILLIVVTGPFILSRLYSFPQAFRSEGSGSFRFHQIKLGFYMLKDNPIGVGLGQFKISSIPYLNTNNFNIPPDPPHNFLLQIMTETGLPGITAFSIFLYLLYKQKLERKILFKRDLNFAIVAGFVTINLLMLVYPWLLHPRIGWLFWTLAAMLTDNEEIN